MSPSRQSSTLHPRMLYVSTTFGFVILVPLYTYFLLVIKGLPDFAASHPFDVVEWVYASTWMAALMSGLLVAASVISVVRSTPFFHQPFDFGRCFSLGGISGALAEIPSTWLYRYLFHRPHSNFWIAGASIAGFLAGATLVPLLLWVVGRPVPLKLKS